MARDVQRALEETARLAQRIYPTLLEPGGLAPALRAAAVSAGARASVDVALGASCRPELARTIYLCWLDALERAGGEVPVTLSVREEEGMLTFRIADDAVRQANAADRSEPGLDWLRDRVDALGGRLAVQQGQGRGTLVSGSLPLVQ
jgi:signal transduction histidine kinase